MASVPGPLAAVHIDLQWGVLAAAFVVAVLLVAPLGRLFVARGLTDPRSGDAALPERKRGQTPQPLSGGALLAAAFVAAVLLGATGTVSLLAIAFVFAAFTVGLVDDLVPEGLGPRTKLLAQSLAAAPLAVLWWDAGPFELAGPLGSLAALAAALVALNVINTWDHADGLVATFLACAATFAGAPILGGASLGLLVGQLRPPASGRPFLGDAGAHLVGALVLLWPAVWPLLLLPGLDLVRVLVARRRAGRPAWEGDRRHLGQALARRGVPSAWIAVGQVLVLWAIWALFG
ncbi:WecA-like glycosyltransferase [Planctomycetes bacterium Pla163]|uniref:WecA-like glycosyltransferase n=1 Tax=Rohdeia mirabilis TaxID=2528008 RepID=A0A518D1I1_9BACT|nr:WecA-like glycosyltransferase [Planctomycetes bacterium Pla163]